MLCHVFFISLLFSVANANGCGRYHRRCAEKAICVDNKKCKCPDPFKGAPLVECHEEGKLQCVLKCDPHLFAYEGAVGNLNFPCKFRLTRVQTNLEDAVPGLAFCSFEVFGFNEVINGKYYASGVEISFAIGDFANQFFRQEDVIKYDVNADGVESSDGQVTEWGTGVHDTWNGIDVMCTFDEVERFAVLEIPRCGFSVRFRPFNFEQDPPHPQSQVPAISIVVGKDTIFGETELGRYPASLCGEGGRQGDDENLYLDRAKFLDLDNPHQALLFDALNQNLEQMSFVPGVTGMVLQDKDKCQAAVDTFHDCPDFVSKAQAVQLCGRIMIKKRVARCLGIHVLEAFRGCVQASCGNKKAGCDLYNAILANNDCKGPRKTNKFCK